MWKDFIDAIGEMLDPDGNNWGQPNSRQPIVSARPQASVTPGTGPRSDNARIRELEHRLDRQSLALQTLLAACIDKGVFTGPEFKDLLIEIDMADGRRDGKAAPDKTPKTCPMCEKKNSHKRVDCMYCGAELGQGLSL